MDQVMEARGRMSASVRFDGTTVTVVRASRALRNNGERSMPVWQIASVIWKPATLLVHGWLGFAGAGMVAPQARAGQQASAALQDPWTVCFYRRGQAEFEELRAAIEHARSVRR